MIDIQSEQVEPRQVQLTIAVSPERIERAVEQVAQEVARKQRIAGYRPGKVPVRAVVARVGEDALREEALDRLTAEVVREAIKAEGIVPWANAEAEVVEREPYTVRALIPLAPEVELGDYSSLRVDPPEAEAVGDDDVDGLLASWREELATLQTHDGPAEEGDSVSLSLVGRLGDEPIYEESALSLGLTPDGAAAANLPASVVGELVGANAGEDRSFGLRYSEFWPQPELRGSEVAFEAKVEAVMRSVPPELDDAFAKDVADVESLAELRSKVRDQLEARAQIETREQYVRSLVDTLVQGSQVSWPPIALEQEVALAIASLRTRVERQGFTWERWLELQGRDAEGLWSEVEPDAAAQLKQRLVLSAFVSAEGLRVDESTVAAEVERLREPFTRSALKSLPSVEEMRRSTGSRMLTGRVIDRLIEISEANRGTGGDDASGDGAAGEEGEETIVEEEQNGETIDE